MARARDILAGVSGAKSGPRNDGSTQRAAPRANLVHVVDDDEGLRESLAFLFDGVGIETRLYDSGEAFLRQVDAETPSVVIVDVRMPRVGGFQVQELLAAQGYPGPVIFCSAHGDIQMSVRAMRHGASDFIEKPYDPQRMLESVEEQLLAAGDLFAKRDRRRRVEDRLALLTPREREVLRLVVDGLPSQHIAQRLGASVKTIDVHRARLRAKTGAESLAVLTRDILTAGVEV